MKKRLFVIGLLIFSLLEIHISIAHQEISLFAEQTNALLDVLPRECTNVFADYAHDYKDIFNLKQSQQKQKLVARPFYEDSKHSAPSPVFGVELHYNKDGKGDLTGALSCTYPLSSDSAVSTVLGNNTHMKMSFVYENGYIRPMLQSFSNQHTMRNETAQFLFNELNGILDENPIKLALLNKECKKIKQDTYADMNKELSIKKETYESLKLLCPEAKIVKSLEKEINELQKKIEQYEQ